MKYQSIYILTNVKRFCIYGFFTMIFVSCGTFINEITMHEDGSGVISNTYDISELLGIIQMMQSSGDGNEQDDDLPSQLLDALAQEGDVDTAFTMLEVLPDSLSHLVDHPELLSKMHSHLRMNSAESTASLTLTISFNNVDEIMQIFEEMLKTEKDNENKMKDMEDIRAQFSRFTIDTENGLISFIENPILVEGMGHPVTDWDEMSEEEKSTMEFIYDTQKSIIIIHLPGMIIEQTHPGGVISDDGKSVTIEEDILEIMQNKTPTSFIVRYK